MCFECAIPVVVERHARRKLPAKPANPSQQHSQQQHKRQAAHPKQRAAEARLAKPRYEGNVISERNNFSPFNPLKPDFVNLPKARHARRKTCTLQPGDMLYMPALTWHQVISTPDEHELNIAANMWFYAKCGTSPYTRVPMAVCGQFGDEVAGEDFRDEGGQYD